MRSNPNWRVYTVCVSLNIIVMFPSNDLTGLSNTVNQQKENSYSATLISGCWPGEYFLPQFRNWCMKSRSESPELLFYNIKLLPQLPPSVFSDYNSSFMAQSYLSNIEILKIRKEKIRQLFHRGCLNLNEWLPGCIKPQTPNTILPFR